MSKKPAPVLDEEIHQAEPAVEPSADHLPVVDHNAEHNAAPHPHPQEPWIELGLSYSYYRQLSREGRLEGFTRKNPPAPVSQDVKPWTKLGISCSYYYQLGREGRLEGYTGKKVLKYQGVRPWTELGISTSTYYKLRKAGKLEEYKKKRFSAVDAGTNIGTDIGAG